MEKSEIAECIEEANKAIVTIRITVYIIYTTTMYVVCLPLIEEIVLLANYFFNGMRVMS